MPDVISGSRFRLVFAYDLLYSAARYAAQEASVCLCKILKLGFGKMHATMQPTLFGAPPATNGFRDSSFAKNKGLPLHRWVPWIAGFSADFVEDCLDSYLQKDGEEAWVLDPFAGVGTTLVQSYLRGVSVIGFEINPYAALATKIKLSAAKICLRDLMRQISCI